jgi:hypothetical protein
MTSDEDVMAAPAEPSEAPVVTRAELDELRRELQVAREEIAQLKADRDEDRRLRPGPVMTNVLAGFIVAGGIAILAIAANSLRTNTPLTVWVAASGATGLVATLILDYSNSLPLKRRNRVLVVGMGGVILAWVIASAILRATVGSAEWDHGGDASMLNLSLVVGAVVGLSLRMMGALGWLRRLWKL